MGISALEGDHRADALKENLEDFMRKVEAGMDLGPYLSRKAHCHGYMLASDPELTDTLTWERQRLFAQCHGSSSFSSWSSHAI